MKSQATLTVTWTCPSGYDHDVDIEAAYVFDGDSHFKVLSVRTLGDTHGISDYDFDALVDEAVLDHAIEEHAARVAEEGGA